MDPDNIDDQPIAKTAGIAPAPKAGALGVLQFTPNASLDAPWADAVGEAVEEAANEVVCYHAASPDQKDRLDNLTSAAADFIFRVVQLCPPGPERSTAISRIREGKFWASAAIALEGC